MFFITTVLLFSCADDDFSTLPEAVSVEDIDYVVSENEAVEAAKKAVLSLNHTQEVVKDSLLKLHLWNIQES